MLHDANKLKSKEAYLAGGGHLVLGASCSGAPGKVLVRMAGFRVPEAVGEGENIHKS